MGSLGKDNVYFVSENRHVSVNEKVMLVTQTVIQSTALFESLELVCFLAALTR